MRDSVDRAGLEGLWIAGPWSLQGECDARGRLAHGLESGLQRVRRVRVRQLGAHRREPSVLGGNTGNIKPTNPWGAFEILLRYSEIDLNDAPVQGGKEHDWTLGANWYLTTHFKFQANYIKAYSDKGNLSLDPTIFELRAQIYF